MQSVVKQSIITQHNQLSQLSLHQLSLHQLSLTQPSLTQLSLTQLSLTQPAVNAHLSEGVCDGRQVPVAARLLVEVVLQRDGGDRVGEQHDEEDEQERIHTPEQMYIYTVLMSRNVFIRLNRRTSTLYT